MLLTQELAVTVIEVSDRNGYCPEPSLYSDGILD